MNEDFCLIILIKEKKYWFIVIFYINVVILLCMIVEVGFQMNDYVVLYQLLDFFVYVRLSNMRFVINLNI